MLKFYKSFANNRDTNSPFRFKNILENLNHFSLEVKRNESLFVFKVKKDLINANKLNLYYTDSSFELEERCFEKGFLKFNKNSEIFIEKLNLNIKLENLFLSTPLLQH